MSRKRGAISEGQHDCVPKRSARLRGLQPALDPVHAPAASSTPGNQGANNVVQREVVDAVVGHGEIDDHPPVEQLTNGQPRPPIIVAAKPVSRSRLPVRVHFPAVNGASSVRHHGAVFSNAANGIACQPSFLGIPEDDAASARRLGVQHPSQSSRSPLGDAAALASSSPAVADFRRSIGSNAGLFEEEEELRQHLMTVRVPEEELQFSSSYSQVVAGQRAPNAVNSNVADNRELINAIVSTLNTVRDVSLSSSNSSLRDRMKFVDKLPSFSGDPREFPIFKRAVDLLFDIEGISDSEVMLKFQVLLSNILSVKDLPLPAQTISTELVKLCKLPRARVATEINTVALFFVLARRSIGDFCQSRLYPQANKVCTFN
ncbi:unnamed protein product [Trichogramma brassicae]|uniref:Uncharacterized protein n=1 Tax=Trichogramma brassicae TaxID=86971 RepID=A0A6H5J254_9HYME|nr:unnamed protein product [Trichogramma brassicae]